MNYETIILECESGVAIITLNRPEKMNALNDKLADELVEAINEINQNDAIRAVIITGSGRAFSAGGDLNLPVFNMAGRPAEIRQFLQKANAIPLGLRNLAKPVIAAVNGIAVGFGHSLVLACDIIIASEEAKFGQAWVNIGYHPDTGSSYFLPRLVGPAKACELIFTGKIIDAKEAEKIGMVNQIVSLDGLMDTARELALKLASGPSVAIGLAKSCIYRGLNVSIEQALDYEMEAAIITFHTEDQQEGLKAFFEKRQPKFKGK